LGIIYVMNKSVFWTSVFDKKKTIDILLSESKADADFYLFLSFASFITTLGLLLNNAIVIVGAMLIAPILFPILSLGMGIVTSSRDAIKRALKILLKSAFVVLFISIVTAFIINQNEVTDQIMLASTPNFLFFLVAFFSGIIASFSWAKQDPQKTLPGVAVTVSLIPPLSAVGVAISFFSRDVFSGSLLLFVINLLGIVLASMVVFSLFGFSRLQKWQDQKIKEEEQQEPK
jgi:uncharacterized hydrophobic protein (TIGR00271 family)